MKKLQNWLLFLLVILLWGSNWSAMKIGLRFVPPITFVLQRFAVSAVAMLPFLVILRKRIPKDRHTLGKLVVLCLIFVSIIIAQAIGLSQENSGIGAVLTYTQPLFVFCLAVPFLGEKITVVKLLGGMIGFIGVIVLFLDRMGSLTIDSALIMLLGALLWAVAVVYYKKHLSDVDAFVTHFFQMAIGALPLAVLSLGTQSFVLPTDILYGCILLYSSIGALAVGNVIWFYLLKREEATTLSGSSLVIPAVAMLFGWQLLGEQVSAQTLLGSALTLSGIFLVNSRNLLIRKKGLKLNDEKGA